MADFKLKKPISNIHTELISKLFSFRTQIHIKHLQTYNEAEHNALKRLYEDVLEITDELAETIQGKLNTRLKGYTSYPFKDDDNMTECINEHIMYITTYRTKLATPSWNNIDNQLQVLQDKMESVLFLLTLK